MATVVQVRMSGFVFVGIGFLLLATAQALAQSPPSPPPGWRSQTLNGAMVLQSPGNGPSQVVLALLPEGHAQGDIKIWFGNQTLALAQSSGRVLGVTEVMEREGVLIRLIQIENKNHVKLREVFYGYPVANGFSLAVLSIPPPNGDGPSLTANYTLVLSGG
jgi:hypothetical protein